MSGPDNFHSQLVGWSKIILPLCALGLLSTLFMFARSAGEPPEFTFAEIEALAKDQRVSAPRFSGVTDNGAVIAIAARTAQPDLIRPDRFKLESVVMRMDNVDGSHVDMTATHGDVDAGANVAEFSGLVRLETSTNYIMETNGLIAELDSGTITSDGLLEVRGPAGELTAGQVKIYVTENNTGQQMLFTNGVHLIYTPQD